MEQKNAVKFVNSNGYEYEISIAADEIMIDAGEGGILSLDEYYRYADAEVERAWFEAMDAEVRQAIAEAAADPDTEHLIRIDPEDLSGVVDVPRKFVVYGYELVEKRATANGHTARIYAPARWSGHDLALIRLN
ncbi:MAG: DUF2080 family transposase-associated protein [Proteiniphilum sp.]|nr:DUF2080 family transposase-associated protein [Proteiniphilum sp.]